MKQRVAVVAVVYHQQKDQQPVSFERRFGRTLQTDEQAYVRRTQAGADPAPLDTGWVGEPGMLIVTNEGDAVLTIGVRGEPIVTVLPGESAQFQPACTLQVWGATRYSVVAVPK